MRELSGNLREKLQKIKMFIMDVDGTLTDGKIYIGQKGEVFKAFHVRDGYGIKMLHDSNIITAIITGRKSEIVDTRAEELGIREVYQGADNKLEVYNLLKKKYDFQDEDIAYIGDDLNDLPIVERAGFRFAVNDCVDELRTHCDYICDKAGGAGAVREAINIMLEVRC